MWLCADTMAVGRFLNSDAIATADDGVAWVRQLVSDLRIPPLATYGLTAGDITEVAEKAAKASSMKGNPIILTPDELGRTLERAMTGPSVWENNA